MTELLDLDAAAIVDVDPATAHGVAPQPHERRLLAVAQWAEAAPAA